MKVKIGLQKKMPDENFLLRSANNRDFQTDKITSRLKPTSHLLHNSKHVTTTDYFAEKKNLKQEQIKKQTIDISVCIFPFERDSCTKPKLSQIAFFVFFNKIIFAH